ncbi:MAG: FtsX-like permease family protein [Oscillospiraceae bacterium]|nr:FtsX-like permease family protein [Oscillospiraceae bacterium]
MRKGGFFPRLALVNLVRNRRYYGPYLLSGIGTAAMYYILRYLTVSDIVASVRGAGYLQSLMGLGCIVVALFSAVLMLYANSFVMKRRQRELGLYHILGLEKRHIAHVMLWETLLCAAVVILGGILVGVGLSKLILLVLLKLSRIPVQFGFEVSGQGMWHTLCLFAVLFLLTLLWNLIRLGRSRPIQLLHGAEMGEREPKTRKLLVAVGLLALAGGYGIALKVKDPLEAFLLFFVAVLLVMLGTYCLFTAGSVAVLKGLRANETFYYQTRHFISVSGLLYRMKQNAVGLANICILSTMVLVTVSTTASLYLGCEETLDRMFPHDIQVSQDLTHLDQPLDPLTQERRQQETEATLAWIDELLEDSGLTAEYLSWYTEVRVSSSYSGNTLGWSEDAPGTYVTVYLVTAEDYTRVTGRTTEMGPDEVLVYAQGLELPDTFYIGAQPFRVAGRLEHGLQQNDPVVVSSSEPTELLLVAADRQALEEIASLCLSDQGVQRETFRIQMDLDGTEEEKLALAWDILETNVDESVYTVTSRQDNAQDLYAMYGGFLFLGVFLGFLFLLATALIIYYKQVSEGYEDQRRYQIMRQVGLTDREARSAIHSQILLVFFLPLGMAAVHILAAFPMISKLLGLFQLQDIPLFAACTAGTLGAFALVYALVYGLTARTYGRIVGA